MRQLLKLIPVFFIILLSNTACKKDNKATLQNHMRFKLDGVQVECDRKFFAIHKSTVGPDEIITFYAGWGDNEVDFHIWSKTSTDITPGQYVFGPGNSYWVEIWPNGTFGSPGNHHSYVAGSMTGSAAVGSGQITIIEINADYIKGSFDFITAVNSLDGLFKTVTNGEFLIKRG